MSVSDAIVVGEAWISEHFFTTEAKSESFQARVLARRKAWDAEDAEGRLTVRSRFTQARQGLEVDLAALGEQSDDALAAAAEDVHTRLLDVLGFTGHGLRHERTGPVIRISAPGITEGAPLVVVLARPVEAVEDLLVKDERTLLEPFALHDDAEDLTSAARLLSALFVADDAPAFALVLAGRWALLAERERWAEGRYLAVDVQLVCERNGTQRGGEVDRALTCLSAESVAPDADGDLWWHSVLEESVKHTVGVSQDLRDGVRFSIEIIANEVVRRRAAQGLAPLPADRAQPLAKQSLRFLYRILFLLYAEASPELGVLPVGAPEYAQGYSLDRLRELVQVELATPQARSGTHLYDSLGLLFRLVDQGHAPTSGGDEAAEGLEFNPLRADLFRPEATVHIDEVGLGNVALQEVLRHLLLSKESRGKDRGFISYAELGINQLGAVYEGLMSYTGFFAETDLYEVAKNGDSSKGSWVVPVDRAEGIESKDFVTVEDPRTGERKPVVHYRGEFVFRLAGRERQQSASYYTPEVLTRFTVGQALEELIDQDGTTTTATEILDLTVCEPALGSGAFAIEAVRQLAEQYLKRRQKELGEQIDPDAYPRELQRVKAYLALHNVYGVDLNATAVELAEISLWLDTMVQGLDAPWFGLHLRRGNSLIGARRAVFRRDEVTSKAYLKDVPKDVPMTSLADDAAHGRLATDVGGGVHHFLLPAAGWGSAVDAKEAKDLAPDAIARLKKWRSGVLKKPSKSQVDALVDLAYRVESLWQIASQRLEIAEREIRRAIPVWGADALPSGGAVRREQIEEALRDASGAYQRLRRVMDAWCALWFWPLTDTLTTREVDGQVERIHPPSLDQWIDALQMLLGRHAGKSKTQAGGDQILSAGIGWNGLGDYEDFDRGFSSAMPVEKVLAAHPWLRVCEAIADQQGFFHWELDFATVFARGGFDLQVGNPPWVRPRSDIDALLAEGDPWWQLAVKPSESLRGAKRATTLSLPGVADLVVDGTSDVASIAAFVGAPQQYSHLAGLQPDLYRCFMEQAWRHGSLRGATGLVHPETHFTDVRATRLRSASYLHQRRFWLFKNARALFDRESLATDGFFGVHIYGAPRGKVAFLMASYIVHPSVIENSLRHDGSGPVPGIKNDSNQWDTTPHRGRIATVDEGVLRAWRELVEPPGTPILHARMVLSVDVGLNRVLTALGTLPRVRNRGARFSRGWDESIDRKKGRFTLAWGAVPNWDDAILQGPNIFVGNPFYKSPNPSMLNKQDWSPVDLEALRPGEMPITSYKPAGDRYEYDIAYTDWGDVEVPIPARDHFVIAWRKMMRVDRERSFIPAILPPGAAHIDGLYSLGLPSGRASDLVLIAAQMCSLLSDFVVKVSPSTNLRSSSIERLPAVLEHPLGIELKLRCLRLNAMTDAYGPLWAEAWDAGFAKDSWATSGLMREVASQCSESWSPDAPLRLAIERRQALIEIDALTALVWGVPVDDLCRIYKTQFPILHKYDRSVYLFDRNGRHVPSAVIAAWRTKGDRITEEERTAVHPGSGIAYTYELPYVTLDREADMRQAYAEFERRLAERS